MARPNKRVRAKLKNAANIQLVADMRNAHDDSKLLQRGRVASSVEKFTKVGGRSANQTHMRPPMPIYDGPTKATPTRIQTRPVVMPDFEVKPQWGLSGVTDASSPRAPKDDDNIRRRKVDV